MKNLGISLIIVAGLSVMAAGASATGSFGLLTVVLPYAAFAVFLIGFLYRIVLWAKAPVPFRITAT